jgi:enoyl-CoA hydratase
MDYEDIRVSRKGAVATIAVDRPEVRNAIRYQTMLEIRDALGPIEADADIRVVVITGTGDKAFISGGDISIMARGGGYVETLAEVPKGQAIGMEIEHFPKPVIARINGVALGGGTEIALCCDIRVAVDTAVMGLPEIKLGIIPGYGGTQRLPRLIGMGKAKELILTGDTLTAQEALGLGLVNQVVPADQLDEAVSRLCGKIAQRGPVALHMAKAAMNNGIQADLKTALDIEARCFSLCFGTQDRVEGMNAFLEKRKARFQGK